MRSLSISLYTRFAVEQPCSPCQSKHGTCRVPRTQLSMRNSEYFRPAAIFRQSFWCAIGAVMCASVLCTDHPRITSAADPCLWPTRAAVESEVRPAVASVLVETVRSRKPEAASSSPAGPIDCYQTRHHCLVQTRVRSILTGSVLFQPLYACAVRLCLCWMWA